MTFDLESETSYPEPVRAALFKLGPRAVEVANRWRLSHPTKFQQMLAAGVLVDAVSRQRDRELEVRLKYPANSPLSLVEMLSEQGVSLGPPV